MKKKTILTLMILTLTLIFLSLIYWFKLRPDQIRKYCREYANQEYEKKFGQPYYDPGPPYPLGQNSLNFWIPVYNNCLNQKGVE